MVHQYQIRRMTVADVLSVYSIDQNTDPSAWSEKLLTDCIGIGYECWVMVDNVQIIGFAIMNFGANEAHLLKIAITAAFHRQGLGQKLLQHMINIAKTQGAEEMYLEVRVSNEPAKALYQKNNFAEIGMRKGYYPADDTRGIPKEDAITMALPLW